MKKENSSFVKGNIQMDNISRKRKFENVDEKCGSSRKNLENIRLLIEKEMMN